MNELLKRNIETVLPTKEALAKALGAGKPLRIKHGIDPTGPQIHIGRAVVLWKLREFQEAGHKIILIFGDFTARIGDPSDKTERRPVLTEEQIEKNLKSYVEQIGKIIDVKNNIEIHKNSAWHDKQTQADLIRLSRLLTVNQMLARRNFSQRMEEKKEIGIDEFLYPLLQGYDSVAIQADVEVGGSDQLFNLTVGRTMQEAYKQKPQFVLTTKMLWGLDGRKMSTSWGNVVNITDKPEEMFGKIMALDDSLISDYLYMATSLTQSEIKEIEEMPEKKQKEMLASEVVKRYYSDKEAKAASEEFARVFGKKELPKDIEKQEIKKGSYTIVELLVTTGMASSKGEARRLVEQGGVQVDRKPVTNPEAQITLDYQLLLQRGKRNFKNIQAV